MRHKITKIIALITLIMFCILIFCCDYVCANNVDNIFNQADEFLTIGEYEQVHTDQHHRAQKYMGYFYNVFLITIIALPLIFLILLKYKKNKIIKKVYIILLIAVMVGFILAKYYIRKKYYSAYAILDMTIYYVLIGFIILKMILNCLINTEKTKDIIIINSIPEICCIITFLIIYLFDWVCSKNYAFKYIGTSLSFWLIILILSNLTMLPIYLLKKEKIKEVKNENTRN